MEKLMQAVQKSAWWAGKIAQHLLPSLTTQIQSHVVEERTDSYKLFSDLNIIMCTHLNTYTKINEQIIKSFF